MILNAMPNTCADGKDIIAEDFRKKNGPQEG